MHGGYRCSCAHTLHESVVMAALWCTSDGQGFRVSSIGSPQLSCVLRVYRQLESIPTTHDEEEERMAADLADLLGPERMPWLQLVHQLIVSEEVMQAEQ